MPCWHGPDSTTVVIVRDRTFQTRILLQLLVLSTLFPKRDTVLSTHFSGCPCLSDPDPGSCWFCQISDTRSIVKKAFGQKLTDLTLFQKEIQLNLRFYFLGGIGYVPVFLFCFLAGAYIAKTQRGRLKFNWVSWKTLWWP